MAICIRPTFRRAGFPSDPASLPARDEEQSRLVPQSSEHWPSIYSTRATALETASIM